MSKIVLEVKDMYGLNGKGAFILNAEKQHNFIYGINASGKSSIARALNDVITKKGYERQFLWDEENFSLSLEFDDIKFNCKNNEDINNLEDYSKRIFIFNKEFIKTSISYEEGTKTNPEIGIRIHEKNELIKENSNLIEKEINKINNLINEKSMPSTSTKWNKNSIFKNAVSSSSAKRESAIIELNNIKEKDALLIDNLTSTDFYIDNKIKVEEFAKAVSKITEKLLEELSSKINSKSYLIKSEVDRKFYEDAINYLNQFSTNIKCPICLETEIDINLVKTLIEDSLKLIITNDAMEKLSTAYNDCKSIDSFLKNEIENIYQSILSYSYPSEDIKKLNERVEDFKINYDQYAIKLLGIDISDETISKLMKNKDIIEEIDGKNIVLNNCDFINEFDNLLKMMFDDKIRAISKKESCKLIIQLCIEGNLKEDKSIEDYYSILSESQKTKISLAFFIALITYQHKKADKHTINKNILCLFDDPIDSYDSLSKYKISRIIHEFITKTYRFKDYSYECNTIFLSHSIEYFRLFKNQYDENQKVDYFILSNGCPQLINSNELYIIQGDYIILNNTIKNSKDIHKLIAVIPILRELSNYSYNILNESKTKKLKDYLSKKIIHGYDDNILLSDLYNELGKYIKIDINNFEKSKNSKIFDIINQNIEKLKNNYVNLGFYDSIMLKNEMSIYIRAIYDCFLNLLLKECDYTENEINNIWEIGCKLKELTKNNDKNSLVRQKYLYEISLINENSSVLNDFAHSAGIFLTPLIDVELDELYRIYNNLNVFLEHIDLYKKKEYTHN